MARRRDKGEERAVAEARILHLLGMAGRAEPALADRYARLSLRIAERYQTGLPPGARSRVCRGCGAFLLPGRTSRVRITKSRVATTCLACGDVRRRPLASRTVTQAKPVAAPGTAKSPPTPGTGMLPRTRSASQGTRSPAPSTRSPSSTRTERSP